MSNPALGRAAMSVCGAGPRATTMWPRRHSTTERTMRTPEAVVRCHVQPDRPLIRTIRDILITLFFFFLVFLSLSTRIVLNFDTYILLFYQPTRSCRCPAIFSSSLPAAVDSIAFRRVSHVHADVSTAAPRNMATIPNDLSLESVRDFMITNGGRVTNHDLVTHFKYFLTNPQNRGKWSDVS